MRVVMSRCRLAWLVVCAGVVATALSGCGTADVAAQRATTGGTATPKPAPSQAVAAAKIADLLVTYAPGSPCADVLVDTPIANVPAACAALWSPLRLHTVPGGTLLQRAPAFPSLGTGTGVSPDEAIRYAAALWRTEAFQGFAVGTRQLTIADALGKDQLFLRVGVMEQAVLQGDVVSTPICHFFPTAMEVVELAPDLAAFVHATGRTLGVHARFSGPCRAVATDAHGTTRELFNFAGSLDVVFVGELRSDQRLGSILWLTGLAECTKDVAKKTCVE
jgi:hypothetical protein